MLEPSNVKYPDRLQGQPPPPVITHFPFTRFLLRIYRQYSHLGFLTGLCIEYFYYNDFNKQRNNTEIELLNVLHLLSDIASILA